MKQICGNCRYADFKSLKDDKVFRGFAFCAKREVKGAHYLNRNSSCHRFEQASEVVLAARENVFGGNEMKGER